MSQNDTKADDAGREIPDGWVRKEVVAGMDTVGLAGFDDDLGMGGGYDCPDCDHYIPIRALDDDTCPVCGHRGMIGTVIMGRQEITALYPEGWFKRPENNQQ